MPEQRNQAVIFEERSPHIRQAHLAVKNVGLERNSLDPATVQLVNVAVMAMARVPEAVRSHARQALEAGATVDQVVDACLLALLPGGSHVWMYALPEVDKAITDFETATR